MASAESANYEPVETGTKTFYVNVATFVAWALEVEVQEHQRVEKLHAEEFNCACTSEAL